MRPTNMAAEQAKADSIPRYQQPMEDAEPEDAIPCGCCDYWLKVSEADVREVMGQVPTYSRLRSDQTSKQSMRKALRRCGVCSVRCEIKACDSHACEMFHAHERSDAE